MSRMRKRAVLVVCLVPLLLWAGWVLASGAIWYRPLLVETSTPVTNAPGVPWRGAVHVHSALSRDATGSLEEIAAAAAAAGLDFVVVSEHTRALGNEGRHEGGWMGDVLVVVGEEVSTFPGHLLALGVPPHPYALGPEPMAAVDDILGLGGQAFVAHPFGGESSWRDGWAGVVGVEVISLSSALYRLGPAATVATAMVAPANPAAAAGRVLAARDPALEDWSQRTALSGNAFPRRLAALAAADAHGPIALGIPSYEDAFAAMSMVVWMPEPPRPGEQATRQTTRLVAQLIAGRSALVLDAVGRAPGLVFSAQDGQGGVSGPGELRRWESGTYTLHASLGGPGPYRILLLRDGAVVAESEGAALTFIAQQPGSYRIEAVRTDVEGIAGTPGHTPWIVSNPIYLWPAEAADAAEVHRAPRLPAPPVTESLLSQPGWVAESDVVSRSAIAPAPYGLKWDVRMAPSEQEDRFAALTWRPDSVVDWRGSDGLAVTLDAERPWRAALRVWTREPGGTEQTWERTVPVDASAPATPALWSSFRRVEGGRAAPQAGGLAEELEHVVGVALVLTPQRMRPGTEATLRLRQIGLFGR